MGMKMKAVTYGAPAIQILAIPDHYVALAFKHAKATVGSPGLAVLVDGRYVVKAGTIYPANDATAVGVVLNDYDVNDGDAMMAVVVHGFIKTAALPALPATAALAAMPLVAFSPLISMGVAITCTPIAIAVGEAQDVEHTVVLTLAGATFRDEAETLSNWTITGEAVNKVAVQSVTISEDRMHATVVTKNTAAAVAGSTTMLVEAAAISTGQVPGAGTIVATVA